MPSLARFLLLAALLGSASVGAAQTLTVAAASSLTEAFEEIAAAFEAATGTPVDLGFAGSSTLAAQIVQGAPFDLFASANEAQMGVVRDAGLVDGEPTLFARNELVVIAAEDGPVRTLADLAAEGTLLVLAGPEVPVGAYARTSLARLDATLGDGFEARVRANIVSEEPNVRQVASKVVLGEADAAIVYATDAAILDGVRTIAIPAGANVQAAYPAAVLTDARDPDLAHSFLVFLGSDAARAILAARGFAPGDPAPRD
jgi:molybdate transport system substrate-binding protein